jgi:uncharacterized membrane protein
MDMLALALLALLWLLTPLAALGVAAAAWFRAARLARAVEALQRRLDEVQFAHVAPPEAAIPPAPVPAIPPAPEAAQAPTRAETPVPVQPATPAPAPSPGPTVREPDVETPRPPPPAASLDQWIVWGAATAGALSLLLGALFGLAVIAERGWLGPSVRVTGALWAAGALIGASARLRSRTPTAASGLAGAGLAAGFAAVYAAHGRYDLIGATSAFAALVAVSAAGSYAAVRQRDGLLGALSLIGGLATPVLVSTGENRPVGLFAYLVVLSGGQLLAAHRRDSVWTALGMLLGQAALFLGWSARWWAPDQAPVALAGVVVLSAPWWFVAARTVGPANRPWSLATAAAIGAVLSPLLALPWVVPVDPLFHDPRTGLSTLRPLAGLPWLAAAAVVLLPAPAAAIAWARRVRWLAAASAGSAGVLLFSAAAGWVATHHPPQAPLLLLAVAPLAIAWAARPEARAGVAGLWVSSGLALAVIARADPPPASAAYAGAVLALVATTHRAPIPLAAGLLGAGIALAGGAVVYPGPHAQAILAATLLALAALGARPLSAPAPGRGTSPTHQVAAFAGIAFAPALLVSWTHAFGDGALGLAPLVIGAVGALGAAVAVRRHRAAVQDRGLALLLVVALGGCVAAVPAQLSAGWLTVAWALLAWATSALWSRIRHPLIPSVAIGLAAVVTVRLVANPYALAYGTTAGRPLQHWPLYTWGVPTLALLGTAVSLARNARGARLGSAAGGVLLAAIAVGFAGINVVVSDAFQDAGPVVLGGASVWQGMVRSISWAVYGLVVLGAGFWRDQRVLRFVGLGIVALATAKVGVVDVWTLSGFVRVGSLVGTGLAMMVVALAFEGWVVRARATKGET